MLVFDNSAMSNDKMNWATIDPESRLYKGKNLYRWDVSPGLEHHCGVCATPLHNSRAKTTCLGKHVEPCYRFHQQLHFVGKSHECFGCNSSDEMHHNRHKEILKIVRQITTIDQGNLGSPSIFTIGGIAGSRRGSTSTPTPTDTSSETFTVEGNKLTRRERKKAKKAGNGTPKDKNNLDVFSTDELGFISEAIHLTKHESKGAWVGTYNYGDSKLDKTTAVEEEEHISSSDTDGKEVAEHSEDFSVKPISSMTPRQRRNLKKYTAHDGQNSFRFGTRKFSPGIVNGIYDGVDPQIFFRLGIEMESPSQNSKSRKELIVKLVATVKEDLEVIEREEAESAMREEGFWRWAGRSAYNAILQTRENFDWATGQKIGPTRGGILLGFEDDEIVGADLGSAEDTNAKRTNSLARSLEPPSVAAPGRIISAKDRVSFGTKKGESMFVTEKRVPAAVAAWSDASRVENKVPVFDDSEWTEVTSSKSKKKTSKVPEIKVTAWSGTISMNVFEATQKEADKKPKIKLGMEIPNDNDDSGEWEVVKKGKGAAKPISASKIQHLLESNKAFRFPGDRTSVSLK